MSGWFQSIISLGPKGKGVHLVHDELVKKLPIHDYKIGLAHFHILHCSAGLTLNENYDPDVRTDMNMALSKLVPDQGLPWVHTDEGPDDSSSHTKTALVGTSVSIPIGNGKLVLGTWQGLYLCEFRNKGGGRKVCVTIQGEKY